MRRIVLALFVAVACLGSTALAADKEPENTDPSFWMQKKLEYTQNILAGIAKEDYDEINKNAMAMGGLNRIESFVRGRTPGYRTQLRVFQFANDELIRQANKENLEGATMAFTQMTISCVNCHKELKAAAE